MLIGIKVDLILPQNRYKQGDTISGVVKVTGGPEAKLANKLSVTLVESYPEITIETTRVPVAPQADAEAESPPPEPPKEIKTETITSHTEACPEIILAQQFQIPAQAALEFPISLTLPAQAAVSGPSQEWHLKTGLDIAGAFDAADTDQLIVIPSDDMAIAREIICQGGRFPTNALLGIEAVDSSGERISKRVYYL